jgi:hypothetical protein
MGEEATPAPGWLLSHLWIPSATATLKTGGNKPAEPADAAKATTALMPRPAGEPNPVNRTGGTAAVIR